MHVGVGKYNFYIYVRYSYWFSTSFVALSRNVDPPAVQKHS